MEPEGVTLTGHGTQFVAEDHVIRRPRGVQVDDVAKRVLAVQAAQHAHDRRDPAARADEEHLLRQRIREHELPLHLAQEHERARLELPVHERRDLARLDELRSD